MLLATNKMSLSNSASTLNNNKRKRSSSMVAIAPLLQRIKNSFIHSSNNQGADYSTTAAPCRSKSSQLPLSEKQQQQEFDEKSTYSTEQGQEAQPKFYALNLEHHSKNYVQPVENWWSSTPPLYTNNNNQQVMIC